MKWLALFGFLVLPSQVFAEVTKFESGARQTTMIELFTSQGCSSCPPAEKYLNTFAGHPKLWKQYIPVAMHVDYWDYLGWKDAFSKSRHSQRQREYARVTRARTVFTPAFFVNGSNWRPGFFRHPPVSDAADAGNLAITVNNNNIVASYNSPSSNTDSLIINIGLVGMGLQTKIEAGENAGRHSKHEFVLLGQTRLTRKTPGKWTGSVPKVSLLQAKRYALIAWVSRSGSPVPVQATGGYLPETFIAGSRRPAR